MKVHVAEVVRVDSGYEWSCACGERGVGYATGGGAAAGAWLHRVLAVFEREAPKARTEYDSWGGE